MMPPPDLDLLTSGDRDYCLAFQGGVPTAVGSDAIKVPIKWKFSFGDNAQGQAFKNLSEKYTLETLTQFEMDTDAHFINFLKSVKIDVHDFDPKPAPDSDMLQDLGPPINQKEKEKPSTIDPTDRKVPDFSMKLELQKLATKMHLRLQEVIQVSLKMKNCPLKEPPTEMEQLTTSRDLKITSIRIYQDIITDLLNHMRYYPESVLFYK